MKIYSLQEIKDLWWKYNHKKCLECDYGEIKHTGSSPNGGWVSYYECESCKTKYEWQDSDMGQTLPDLRSNADESHNLSKELFKQPEMNIGRKTLTFTEYILQDFVKEGRILINMPITRKFISAAYRIKVDEPQIAIYYLVDETDDLCEVEIKVLGKGEGSSEEEYLGGVVIHPLSGEPLLIYQK